MRSLSIEAATVLDGGVIVAAHLIEMAFEPALRICTAAVDLDWNGLTWTGVALVGQIDAIKDAAGTSEGVRFTLSGVPSANIALALGSSVRNRLCKVYFAIMDPQTHQVLDAPLIWAGVLDQMQLSEGSGTSSISVTAKHIGSLFSRVKSINYTDADQRKLYPGDTSLRFITNQATHKDTWPSASYFKQ